jgi:hypothetical protein
MPQRENLSAPSTHSHRGTGDLLAHGAGDRFFRSCRLDPIDQRSLKMHPPGSRNEREPKCQGEAPKFMPRAPSITQAPLGLGGQRTFSPDKATT